jgi:hypothetical protein
LTDTETVVSPLQGTSGTTVEGLIVGMLLVTRLKEWEIKLLLKQMKSNDK